MKSRNIILIIALILIISTIYYLESTAPKIDNSVVKSEIPLELNTNSSLTDADKKRIDQKADKYERAKELVNPEGYINIDNITISENIGKKVILVDFWTYSCINCQRTLPYLTSWHNKYSNQGLLIIGVHTPEFEFEKDYNNLLNAVHKWNITYPVVQDNDRETWRSYKNRYWPRKYVIDIDGFIVYDHIGEGAYMETEQVIQDLLQERKEILNANTQLSKDFVNIKEQNKTKGLTKEIYFGYGFAREQLGNKQGWQQDKIVNYTTEKNREHDKFYLSGTFQNNKDNMETISDTAMIYLDYYAKNVNIVAGANTESKIAVYLDDEKVNEITVKEHDIYNLVTLNEANKHSLKLKLVKGIKAYTFTFG